jgi:hypothetical protein
MMPVNTKPGSVQARDKSSPMRCAYEPPKSAPNSITQILHSKGFGGGVPINTETAAVKPRVGIE